MADTTPNRNKFLNYDLKAVLQQEQFACYNTEDVNTFRFAMIGASGAGKSASVVTFEKIFREDGIGTARIQSSGGEGTILLEEYLEEFPFRLVDTRGFFTHDAREYQALIAVLDGHVSTGTEVTWNQFSSEVIERPPNPDFDSLIHGVIWVIKANDPRLEILENDIVNFRSAVQERGLGSITLITHCDLICPSEVHRLKKKIGSITGSPLVYAMKNVPEGPTKEDAQQLFSCMDTMILLAEQFIITHKTSQQIKNSTPRRSMASPKETAQETKTGQTGQQGTCIVCCDSRSNLCFGCGHVCTCETCGLKLSVCPLCRKPISTRSKVWIV